MRLLIVFAGLALALLGFACSDASEGGPEVTSVPSPTATGAAPGTGVSPPPATATAAGGASVPLGIGTYCWSEPGKGGLCIDKVGPVTSTEALALTRGTTVTVANPVAGSAIREGSVSAWPAPAQPLATNPTELLWSLQPGTGATLRAAVTADRIEFIADLAPGRHVVSVMLFLPAGDVSYGLLLEVR